MMSILVTGGAGFIGSHTVVQLLNEGFRVSIIDNLDNSVMEAVYRVRDLVGPELYQNLEFHLVSYFTNFSVRLPRKGEENGMFCAMLVLISDNKAQLVCFIHFLAFLATERCVWEFGSV
jgi:hypothetical protein